MSSAVSSKFSSTIVGALACQKNSYLKSFTTTVVRCQEHKTPKDSSKEKNKKNKKSSDSVESTEIKKYEVELADTILFPEGGGQPTDEGSIILKNDNSGKEIHVFKVFRDNLIALHITSGYIEPGTEVDLKLQWSRRFDHMQQHTGQHLLSAILDQHNLPTLGWNMGDMINYVEIPKKLTAEEVEDISEQVNNAILDRVPISVIVPDKDQVNKSKMPDDYDLNEGVLRVVKIGELDENPCCGTHLSNTSEIISISLLHQTTVRGTNSRLHFICGDRVRKYSVYQHNILKKLCSNLSCQADEIIEKVDLLSVNLRKTTSKENNLVKELALYKSREVLKTLENKDFAYVYKADAGLEFLNQISKELNNSGTELSDKTIVLLSGDSSNGGTIIISGKKTEELAKLLKERLSNLKGGGKGKFQGKISKFEKGEIESVLRYFDEL